MRIEVWKDDMRAMQTRFRISKSKVQELTWGVSETVAGIYAARIRTEVRGKADRYGFVWTGEMLDSVEFRKVANNETDVLMDTKVLPVARGTKPHPRAIKPPYNLVLWTLDKIFNDLRLAYPIALEIYRKGILGTTRAKYEGRGFNFAAYAIDHSQGEVNKAVDYCTDIIVHYLESDRPMQYSPVEEFKRVNVDLVRMRG